MENTPLDFWRLAENLSVEVAAILIAGGSPVPGFTYFEVERRYPGFSAALAALKDAILSGKLPATLRYSPLKLYPQDGRSNHWAVFVDRERVGMLPSFEVLFRDGRDGFVIDGEPDWEATMVEVVDVKEWLASRGHLTGFFFEDPTRLDKPRPNVEDFMDTEHPNHAPELALAVEAWRRVSAESKLKTSPKAAVQSWLESRLPSIVGLQADRISTVVNWDKKGGAPKSGG
ncbi:MAG: hypothetical protein V4586_13800 [Pseudomonadota bacterium]